MNIGLVTWLRVEGRIWRKIADAHLMVKYGMGKEANTQRRVDQAGIRCLPQNLSRVRICRGLFFSEERGNPNAQSCTDGNDFEVCH